MLCVERRIFRFAWVSKNMIQISLFSRSIPIYSYCYLLVRLSVPNQNGESIKAEESQEGSTDIELPKNGSNIFIHDNLQRQYRVHIPENLPSNAPLVIVMHGYTSSAEVIEGYSKMNDIADENGFVVAYPQGTKDGWGNSFLSCWL